MLKKLEILNGHLELEFNEYTYEYTVTVKDDIMSLDFNYDLMEDCYINIRNNNLNNEENIVYVDVYNLDNTITYTFYVYKDIIETVNGIDNFVSSLEVKKTEEVDFYKVQLLTTSIFLIIVIIFSIIFKRKHT